MFSKVFHSDFHHRHLNCMYCIASIKNSKFLLVPLSKRQIEYKTTLIRSYLSSADPNQQKSKFCFSIFSIFVFNGFLLFSATTLNKRCKPSILVSKPIQSYNLQIRTCKLDANSSKNEDLRVPHLKTTKTAVMTSFNVFSIFLRKCNVFYCFLEYFTVTATTVTKSVCIADIEICQNVKMSVISVILTANYVTDDANTVIFIISGSKSSIIVVLFFVFLKFYV